MPPAMLVRRSWPGFVLLAATALTARADGPKVPEGFEARLVASVPAVEFPSQVATAPDGSLFVAEDPMDQVGPYEAFDGIILRFRDGQEPVRFAEGFRAIQGMAWHDDALYVCHMPFLTIVRDTDGDGKADKKEDLFKDLGQTHNQGLNDHIVSGIQFGMDGWLYIAVGDKGVPGATRPEDGQVVQLKGGGILRCRPDGRELEVYSSGTRNHLEPNLSALDEVFTYDNTDDGDGWWTRVTYHVDGGYYGYPYDYHEHKERFLDRLAEYGGGSPCGGIVYKEDVWPEAFRGMAFWAEWGKGKVQGIRFERDGASYRVAEMIDFAAPDGVNDFRPIDLALSYDGKTLYVADWNMGGWGNKEEKVGRVWAITYTGPSESRPRGTDDAPVEAQIRQLDHPSFNERMRAQNAIVKSGQAALPAIKASLNDPNMPALAKRHLVWALDAIAGATPEATFPLMEALKAPEAEVRAQAARALGEREAPVAVDPLVTLLQDEDPTVRLQAVIALGRIGDAHAIPALIQTLCDPERYVSFSARQALRRINDWAKAAEGLASKDERVRSELMLAMEQVYDVDSVKALAGIVADRDHAADERARAVGYLASVHREARPWDGHWWGTRPTQGKPPAKVDAWEGTELVLDSVASALSDPEIAVRKEAVVAETEIADPDSLPLLRARFAAEPDVETRCVVARALGQLGDRDALPALVATLKDGQAPDVLREAALGAVEVIGTEVATRALLDLLNQPDLPLERQPRVISALGRSKAREAVPALLDALSSPSAEVRATSAEALGSIGQTEGVSPKIRPLLEDPDLDVCKAAILSLMALKDRESLPALLVAAEKAETQYEASRALAAMPDSKALQVYLRGLSGRNPRLRFESAAAISAIQDQAAPLLEQLASRKELSPSTLPDLRRIFSGIRPIVSWQIIGPFPRKTESPIPLDQRIDANTSYDGLNGKRVTWREVKGFGRSGMIDLGQVFGGDQRCAFGYAELESPEARKAEVVAGSDDSLTVWVNGKQVFDHPDDRGYAPDQDRFEIDLESGTNRILVRCGNSGGGWQFRVAVADPTKYAFLEGPAPDAFNPDVYRSFAMESKGNPEHGKALFSDLQGLACVKCHTVGGQGGQVGPDLSGIGARYARPELIESVLYPSAKIFSGYEPVVVATSDGRVVTGVLKSETEEGLELLDSEAQPVSIAKDDIDERKNSDVSIMPSGLAEGLSQEDFADLIAYLETLKEATPATPAQTGGGSR